MRRSYYAYSKSWNMGFEPTTPPGNTAVEQGHDDGAVTLYQDNLSCMALVKRGPSTSDRTRHVSIRYFWVKERVDQGEAVIEHLRTESMYANLLTKPLQGAQFVTEREALTNWSEAPKPV